MKINWVLKKFDDLSPHELYAIIQLRNEVFVVEQNCVFQDADNKDQSAFHLMGWSDKKMVAYARILYLDIVHKNVSIGRVVTSPEVRRKAIGKELMLISIEQIKKLFGNVSIHIGAQLYLKKFYESFGFSQSSNTYLEDGIEHIEMLRPASVS